LRGASIAGGGFAVTQAISLATYLVLARLLRPADLGAYAAGALLLSLGLVVGESGMTAALIRRRDRLEEAFNTAVVATVGGGLALTVAGIIAAPLVGLVFGSFTVGLLSAAMAGIMLLRLAAIVPNARLQRNFSFLRRALLDPLGSLLFAAGAVAGAFAGFGPWALVLGTYAQYLVDTVVAWAMVRWRPRPKLATMSMWRELARFGRPIFGAHIIQRGTAQLPVIAVGRALGAAALGQFTFAIKVGTQPSAAIVDVGAYSLLPALARISHDSARFREAVLRTLRWGSALAFPITLVLVPLGTPAIVLVFGAKWLTAGYAVMALGVYCAVLYFYSVSSEVWKAAGRPGMLPRMHGLSFVMTAVCVGAAAPFGVVPVAGAMVVSATVVAVYAVRGMGAVVGLAARRMVAEIWPPAVSAAAMAGILFVTEHLLLHSDHHSHPVGIALLAVQTVFGLLIYLGCLVALSSSCRRELAAAFRRGRPRPITQPA
jgi:PST family polysaccharide transporter